jgi:serine/threonine protein kinase
VKCVRAYSRANFPVDGSYRKLRIDTASGPSFMPETVTRAGGNVPQLDSAWQRRLDALICGECTEEDFLQSCRLLNADSAWNVVALLDQRFRRGQMPVELFRSIESKIARRELGALDYGTTVELGIEVEIDTDAAILIGTPAATPSPAAAPASPPAATPAQAAAATAAATPAPAPRMPANSVHPLHGAGIGRVLRGRYVLECRLGNGGMGTVFKAQDRYRCDLPQADRLVAIKFLHEKPGGRAEVLSSLRREFYCAQALSHPNIVKVYDLDRDGDDEFFTMEYLEGELLSRVIEHLDPLTMSRARAWAIIGELAAGLAHAHARNVVHADLKPQNIMITKSGEVRILDFGASSTDAAERNNSSAVTPAYASCELVEGQRADPRDDLFALACVAYELLAGQHPFQRRRSTEARDLGLPIERPRGLTRRQWRTLAQGLAWRREERSVSVEDWMARLHPASAGWVRPAAATVFLLAVLGVGAGLSVLFNERRTVIEAAPEMVAGMAIAPSPPGAPAPTSSAPTSSAPTSSAPTSSAPKTAASTESPANGRRVLDSPEKRAVTPMPTSRPARSPASSAAPAKAPSDSITLSAKSYRVGVHKNFAELHVRRSFASESDTSFSWWTEPSTAQPGADYVPQGRTVQVLSKRNQMASLFVKMVPNASRKHSAVFYVVIGEPGDGIALGRVTRTAVVLPAQ